MTSHISRSSDYAVDPDILGRWSPRAFIPTTISKQDLFTVLEAARWAPSAFNAQPWRFVYAMRDSAVWPVFVDLLAPFNRKWAQNASAMVVIVSRTLRTNPENGAEEESYSHSFDSGAAWALMAVQARKCGLFTHAMTGFDKNRARTSLEIPEQYRIEAAIAIGLQGAGDALPDDLRAKEKPSLRKSLSELASEGAFGTD